MGFKEIKISKNLESLAQSQGMTLSALSRKSGVPRSTLSSWIYQASPKNFTQLAQIAEVLSISVDELLFGKSKKQELSAPLAAPQIQSQYQNQNKNKEKTSASSSGSFLESLINTQTFEVTIRKK